MKLSKSIYDIVCLQYILLFKYDMQFIINLITIIKRAFINSYQLTNNNNVFIYVLLFYLNLIGELCLTNR